MSSQPRSSRSPVASSLRPVIGWREWIALPELGIHRVKVKVDTGARSSSLHALDVQEFRRGRRTWVRFRVKPIQRNTVYAVHAEAELVEHRKVKSSGGHQTLRPVIRTTVELFRARWEIELTLVSRDAMGFRMLLGRQAVRGRFLVDPGRSFAGGLPRSLPRRRPRR